MQYTSISLILRVQPADPESPTWRCTVDEGGSTEVLNFDDEAALTAYIGRRMSAFIGPVSSSSDADAGQERTFGQASFA